MMHLIVWNEWRGWINRRRIYAWCVTDANGNVIADGAKDYASLGALHDDIRAMLNVLNVNLDRPVPIYEGKPDHVSRF